MFYILQNICTGLYGTDPVEETSKDAVFDSRGFARVEQLNFVEYHAVIVQLFLASILLDCDVTKADNKGFHGLYRWLIVDHRLGQRTGDGRWTRGAALLVRRLLGYPPLDPALYNDGLTAPIYIKRLAYYRNVFFFSLLLGSTYRFLGVVEGHESSGRVDPFVS